jgi:hypothetical protein
MNVCAKFVAFYGNFKSLLIFLTILICSVKIFNYPTPVHIPRPRGI